MVSSSKISLGAIFMAAMALNSHAMLMHQTMHLAVQPQGGRPPVRSGGTFDPFKTNRRMITAHRRHMLDREGEVLVARYQVIPPDRVRPVTPMTTNTGAGSGAARPGRPVRDGQPDLHSIERRGGGLQGDADSKPMQGSTPMQGDVESNSNGDS